MTSDEHRSRTEWADPTGDRAIQLAERPATAPRRIDPPPRKLRAVAPNRPRVRKR
jgi:hypothetical protein